MTNTKLFLLIGTSLSFLPALSFAQCVATQDCVTLGYTETSCNGGKGVKCPFGNKWCCFETEESVCSQNGFKYACSGTGYSGGSGDSCGGKYKKCNCKSGYKWSGSACKKESCSSSYKYTCSGTGYAGGAGSVCGGKYTKCNCKSGYEWSGSACKKESCSSSYKYTCTGTGYAGGSGSVCDGKYTSCTCSSGYEWIDGSCQKEALNGAQGNLYYCNGKVIGVKVGFGFMGFYLAMKDTGKMSFPDSETVCQDYSECEIGSKKPTKEQLSTIYSYKSQINSLLLKYGGTALTEGWYWSENRYGGGSSGNCISVNLANGDHNSWTDDDYAYSVRCIFGSLY